ncbi:hypothetical protein MTR_1g075420 [Medicago truncatula]|uniref:Uncharacterized protein n=1 Tax=Medicago truncatula TaxID=3880 RepID=G7I4R7_MEDTR|nr:hypothetical protein MTR_1g075420 [Medicago truncatula]
MWRMMALSRNFEEKLKSVPTGNFEEKPKPVPTGVRVIQVNTRSFFTTNERWKDREELLGWVRRQAGRAGFTISIDKSSTIVPYMTMSCERSGEYKPPKTRKNRSLKARAQGSGFFSFWIDKPPSTSSCLRS